MVRCEAAAPRAASACCIQQASCGYMPACAEPCMRAHTAVAGACQPAVQLTTAAVTQWPNTQSRVPHLQDVGSMLQVLQPCRQQAGLLQEQLSTPRHGPQARLQRRRHQLSQHPQQVLLCCSGAAQPPAQLAQQLWAGQHQGAAGQRHRRALPPLQLLLSQPLPAMSRAMW